MEKTINSVTLPVREAITRWVRAASVAGAALPAYVGDYLARLPWETRGRDCVDAYSIAEAICDATRECGLAHAGDYPMPRGLYVSWMTDGGMDVTWESDTHVLRLVFATSPHRAQWSLQCDHGTVYDADRVLLTCDGPEGSERMQIVSGEQVTA